MNDFIKEHGGTIVQNQKDCNFVITKNIHKVRIALKDEIPWFDPTNDSLKLIETANGVFSEDCLIDYFVKIKSEVPFVGREFKNSSNVCYINALLNGLMSLNCYREKVYEGFCKCNLCKFLKCTKNLDTNPMREYAAKLNGERFEKYEQEDVTELLLTLIPPCKVLEKLIKLQENKIFTCTVCKQVSNKLQNGNLTKIVHFNANFSIESISDMVERESKDKIEKVCYNCEQNNK